MNAERATTGVGGEHHPTPPPPSMGPQQPYQLPPHQLLGLAGLVAGAGMAGAGIPGAGIPPNVSNNVNNMPMGPVAMTMAAAAAAAGPPSSTTTSTSSSTNSDLARGLAELTRNIPSTSTGGDGGGGGGGGGGIVGTGGNDGGGGGGSSTSAGGGAGSGGGGGVNLGGNPGGPPGTPVSGGGAGGIGGGGGLGGGGGIGGMGGMIPGMGPGMPRPPLPPAFFNLENSPGMPWGGWADLQDSMALERGRSRNWTYEETLELINLYTSDEWQNKFSNEKKNHRAIWGSLAAALTRRKDVSGDEARQRLNNLKALYNRTRRQLLSGEIASPQWEYWEPLHAFLGRPQPYIPITSPSPQPRPAPGIHGFGHHHYQQHHQQHHHPHPQGLFGALGLSSPMHYQMNMPPRPFMKPSPEITFDEFPREGLTGADDRGSSEFSQNEDETTGNASPEHFLGETSEREPTPAPVVQTPPKPESYQLRHNNHLTIVLEALARDEAFMDVTLTAQGRSLKAHKSVLSAVSPYFRGVLRDNPCQHPIIIMPRDVRFEELFSIVNYIYKGEMTVAAEDLTSLLKTAEILQVSGLAPSDSTATVNPHNIRSSSASSSSSSSNIPHISKVSKTIKEPNRGISAPVARAKSPENMINPSDFMDMDMTYVKEEVESGGEEEPAAASEMTSTPSTQQPEQIASPKTNDTQQQESMTFSSMYNQNQEQTMTPTSGFSHETSNNVPVKSETEADGRQDTDQLQNGTENPQPFVCPHCQGQHRGIENMNSHLRLNHPTKPSFPCLCGRVFIRSMSHQIHIKTCSTASS